jgi:hypothetical protein
MRDKRNENVVGVAWVSGRSSICVIIGWYPEDEELKGYICSVKGDNQEDDIEDTYNWGSRIPLDIAENIINKLGGWLKPEKTNWKPIKSPIRFNIKPKEDIFPDMDFNDWLSQAKERNKLGPF